MHTLCQMALYHSLGGADHGRWRHNAAAFDRDAAARVEPAARRNIGRVRHGVTEADIGHAQARFANLVVFGVFALSMGLLRPRLLRHRLERAMRLNA